LIVFLEASHIVSNERGSTLLALSGSEPDAAQALLARSTDLRDSLRKIFGAMVRKEAIAPIGRSLSTESCALPRGTTN